ncbi:MULTISPECIES: DMT family transporter [Sphingobacterium]|uniref:Multidrug efflux SMR transporter n=1 Tax=Sphingobacterium hotanense TaxID=649196 RepID=A0ABT7NNE8_9SPHI|nr:MULTISPECIES: multidrug efflux SMR transporter [Sphingobacterium]MDM1048738.1 multidrug efflux SMR transporter [Sphingobacterium hotanense]
MKYLFLALAIISEVVGSSFLNASQQFTKPIPAIVTVVAYGLCFYFLSIALKTIPLGMAYAIWGGLGIILTAIVSVVIFRHSLDLPAVLGIMLIVAGVVVLNVFSKSMSH